MSEPTSEPTSEPIPETAPVLAPNLTPLLPMAAEVTVVHPLRERYWLHALLLFATILTTLTVGAGMQFNFQNNFAAYSVTTMPLLFSPGSGSSTTPRDCYLEFPFPRRSC